MSTSDGPQVPQSEEVMRQALRDYAMVTLDSSGKIVQWSEGAEKIFGWREAEVIGRTFDVLFTPQDRAARTPAEELARSAEGEPAPDERWHLRKDGSQVFLSGFVRPLRAPDGEITGFCKLARDITAQKLQQLQQESALHRERVGLLEAVKRWKYLEEIFENLPALVGLVRLPEQTYVFANRSLRELAGGNELIGRNFREALPVLGGEHLRPFETVAATEHPYVAKEQVIRTPDSIGSQGRYFDFAYQPMRSETGDYEGVLIFAVDVTERVRTREASEQASRELAAERDRLQIEVEKRKRSEVLAGEHAALLAEQAALLDLAQDGIMAMNLEGIIEHWNSGAEKMYGWSKREAIGRNIHELLHTEFPQPLEEIWRVLFTAGEWEGELKHRSRLDKELLVSSRWVLRKRDGAIAGWLEICRDITEHKKIDAHLRQADKLESLGILAGGIAHDFNNILTGVMGNIGLAMEIGEAGSPVNKLLTSALQASERAAMLTRQMLAYAGKGEFVVENVDVSAVVRKTIELVGSSIPNDVQLDLALADELPPVRAGETQVEQVVMNLILNAAEAISERSGKIFVRTGAVEIDMAGAAQPYDIGRPEPGQYVSLEVRDTGSGIDPSIRASIFDPFFTTKFTGRGLGLAALSGIVRALKGAVLVDSKPGEGALFRVLLPTGGPAHGLQAVPPAAEQRLPILVVDDEEVVRQVAYAILHGRGYEVLLAASGQEALNIVRERNGRIALVLLDMAMPAMPGEEVFRRLKRIHPDIPVVVSSGYTEQEAVRRFGGLGVIGFVQKPYSPKELMEKLAAALQR
ncbi:MAG TPA: PAS domain S-box protein [Bryobacteraceae bacterium]|nr:PAS domain S-box protein [Bryobacteraceae bacterium]